MTVAELSLNAAAGKVIAYLATPITPYLAENYAVSAQWLTTGSGKIEHNGCFIHCAVLARKVQPISSASLGMKPWSQSLTK
jgi:hypothetical protein